MSASRPDPVKDLTFAPSALEGVPDPARPLGPVEPARCVHEAFVARAAETPEALALRSAHGLCSYGELEAISRGLAQALLARGLPAGSTVAIFATRGPALVYAMLAVLRAGAAFQVVDAAYPVARIEACLTESAPALLLVAGEVALPSALEAAFPLHEARRLGVPSVAAEALAAFAPSEGVALPEVDPHAIAYMSFTSGSTGTPKGIVTTHAPLPHFVTWHVAHGALTRDDRFALLSGLSHDPMLRDVFTPLSLGASLAIPPQDTIFDAEALFAFASEQTVSVLHVTPAIGEILALGAPEGGTLPALRRVYWGGDVLPASLVRRIAALAPSVLQTNFYGATETPQAMAYYDLTVDALPAAIPIGRGIDAAQLLVVTSDGRLTQPGETGEIWIRSPYLARGYLADRALTEARFVPSPFGSAADDRCYRTGDLGRYAEDGSVSFAGRADHQLKIRGFRVEPSEIVRALEQQAEVARALVVPREEPSGKQLVAYVVLAPHASVEAGALRRALEQELPSYMVPRHVVLLEALPLLPNGKVDLRALPAPELATKSEASAGRRLPETEAQRQLAAIWADILGLEDVGLDESFLDLGGDSLSAIRALSRMRRLGLSESVARGIFQGRTIAELTGERPPSDQTVRPLRGAVKTTLFINVLRGVLVLLLVFDHWREGIFKRLHIPMAITDAIEFVFHMPTPGFAFVFGIGLGYTHYEAYLRNASASRRLLAGGAALLAVGTLVMGVSRDLGELAKGMTADPDRFIENFFLPTLYYWMALATAPAWFWLMRRREGKWGGSLLASVLLAGASRGLYELMRALLLEHEPHGLLQLGRLMLTARFSYFNLSTGALLGSAFGLYLRRRRTHDNLIPMLTTLGGAFVALALLLYLPQRARYPDGLMSADIWLPEWFFYVGATLLVGALVEALLLVARAALLRATLEWVGVVGQCAMPIFILQGMVLDFTAFGRAAGLRDGLAVAAALGGFALVVGWMMRRIHGLYYGRVPDEPAASAPTPLGV